MTVRQQWVGNLGVGQIGITVHTPFQKTYSCLDWNGPQVISLFSNALGRCKANFCSSLWRWCRWCWTVGGAGDSGGVDPSHFFQPRQSQFVDDVAAVQRYLTTSKHKRERRASYSDDSIGLLLQQVVQVVCKGFPSQSRLVGMNEANHPTAFYNSPFQNGRLCNVVWQSQKLHSSVLNSKSMSYNLILWGLFNQIILMKLPCALWLSVIFANICPPPPTLKTCLNHV